MDENECLVGELRKYLSTAKYTTQDHESEQVQSLKRDLNLAARVGQQLLMQLQAAEKSRAATEQELAELKAKNAQLMDENSQLACEHEIMTESISQQEAEIATLSARLREAQSKTERLKRATAAAKALEREVQLLERMQVDLRQELEHRTQQKEDAQKLAKHLASSLAQHVASNYQEVRRNVTHSDVPSLTLDNTSNGDTNTTDDAQSVTVVHEDGSDAVKIANADTSLTSFDAELDLSITNMSILPRDTGTPLKFHNREKAPVASSRSLAPQLIRSKSHESVLSIIETVPAPSPVVATTTAAPKLATTALPKAVTAISGEHSLAFSQAAEPSAPARSARDRLSQMRNVPSAVPDRRRWAFTPFRALQRD